MVPPNSFPTLVFHSVHANMSSPGVARSQLTNIACMQRTPGTPLPAQGAIQAASGTLSAFGCFFIAASEAASGVGLHSKPHVLVVFVVHRARSCAQVGDGGYMSAASSRGNVFG